MKICEKDDHKSESGGCPIFKQQQSLFSRYPARIERQVLTLVASKIDPHSMRLYGLTL